MRSSWVGTTTLGIGGWWHVSLLRPVVRALLIASIADMVPRYRVRASLEPPQSVRGALAEDRD